jgi:hypothetical protein
MIDNVLAGVAFPYRMSNLFTLPCIISLIFSSRHLYWRVSAHHLAASIRVVVFDESQIHLSFYDRPMVSYGAFDSPTYYIDITPFLPHLSDGLAHNFTINVAGMGTNHSINADWIVSGNVQVAALSRVALSERPSDSSA